MNTTTTQKQFTYKFTISKLYSILFNNIPEYIVEYFENNEYYLDGKRIRNILYIYNHCSQCGFYVITFEDYSMLQLTKDSYVYKQITLYDVFEYKLYELLNLFIGNKQIKNVITYDNKYTLGDDDNYYIVIFDDYSTDTFTSTIEITVIEEISSENNNI